LAPDFPAQDGSLPKETPMLIVDAQVHVWAADTPERPWPPGRHKAHRPQPLGPEELLREMDAAGVDRAVLVPPSWEGERNDLVLAAAHAHPTRFAVMGRLDPDAADARARLADWRAQGMLGLRFSLHRPFSEPILTEGRMDWVWAECERLGLPVYVLVKHATVHLIDDVAARYPGLRLVMDHCALDSSKRDDEAFRDFDRLLVIARRPNVAAKVSCFPAYTTDRYPYRYTHDYIRRVFDAFGPRRTFWGTDLSRLPCTYREGVTMFTQELPWLQGDDLAWVMGRGLCQWIGW
jgi:predicted TIM-barrel fold metal-dependent hydrolase